MQLMTTYIMKTNHLLYFMKKSRRRFKKGDTIVTSGYSAVFPPDIPVGTIISHEKEHDGVHAQ